MAVQLMKAMGDVQVEIRPVISWEVAYTQSIKSRGPNGL